MYLEGYYIMFTQHCACLMYNRFMTSMYQTFKKKNDIIYILYAVYRNIAEILHSLVHGGVDYREGMGVL